MNAHTQAETMRKTGFLINTNMRKCEDDIQPGSESSLARPNKHERGSGQHKEHSVSALVPQLWLPAPVQGNGKESLKKKEPRGAGGGGVDGLNLLSRGLEQWDAHKNIIAFL